jgi:hypothetical protein
VPYPLDLKMQNFGFGNWTEAATNAKNLLDQMHIDPNEYGTILARAKQEQAGSVSGQGAAQQAPTQQGQTISSPPQPQPNPTADPMNGRALPVQSLPTWDQVMRFMREISGPRPAY